ncbi:C40 family peptidase [Actinomyces urinae]|uniref:C40 family peptidase n=1 Tax=Actinomyces urinae TaxID=1689268 RepID=UPI000AC1D553|nr:C40 family peptidase [Actinomyces urinae]
MAKKIEARHRRACRPVTPLTDITESISPVRGVATVSATGLALTVLGSGIATAAPDSALDLAPKAPPTIQEGRIAQANPVLTAPADVEWASGDDLSVSVEIVEEAVEEDALDGRDEAADRGYERESFEQSQATPVSIPSASASSAVGVASQYIGVPYVWAGASPSGFDCSGLVSYVYGQLGYSLPHSSYGIGASGTHVPASEAAPGDIVYYGGHVGIYAGNGMMIHSPAPGRGVEYAAVYGAPSYVRL